MPEDDEDTFFQVIQTDGAHLVSTNMDAEDLEDIHDLIREMIDRSQVRLSDETRTIH